MHQELATQQDSEPEAQGQGHLQPSWDVSSWQVWGQVAKKRNWTYFEQLRLGFSLHYTNWPEILASNQLYKKLLESATRII